MLVLLAADGTRLDAGSVGLALTRRWADAGAQALFVDADTDGTRLARRLGQVAFADYSPAARGLPSLIVAREPLTLRLLADHCYSLDTAAGSLWALFAPSHPDGGEHAAQWLAERAGDLATVGRERAVLVASRFSNGADLFASAPWSAAVLVVLAAVPSADAAKGLAALCRDARLSSSRCPHRALIVEGDTALSDEVLAIETGMHVAGRLPLVDDETVLRLRGGRRERAFLNSLDEIAERLLSYAIRVASAARETQPVPHPVPIAEARPLANGVPSEQEASSGVA